VNLLSFHRWRATWKIISPHPHEDFHSLPSIIPLTVMFTLPATGSLLICRRWEHLAVDVSLPLRGENAAPDSISLAGSLPARCQRPSAPWHLCRGNRSHRIIYRAISPAVGSSPSLVLIIARCMAWKLANSFLIPSRATAFYLPIEGRM